MENRDKKFKELFGKITFDKLLKEDREILLKKYEEELDKETLTVRKTISTLRTNSREINLLLAGVSFGILGGMLAQAVDRLVLPSFEGKEILYALFVILLMVILFNKSNKEYDKLKEEILRSNKYVDEMFKKIENKK